jgi:hypothetical protein
MKPSKRWQLPQWRYEQGAYLVLIILSRNRHGRCLPTLHPADVKGAPKNQKILHAGTFIVRHHDRDRIGLKPIRCRQAVDLKA